MGRRKSVIGLVLASAALAFAAATQAASAATFCVQDATCVGTNEPDVQTALNAAKSATPGPNIVQVGAGTFDGRLGYFGSSLPALTLQGAGPGKTILTYSGGNVAGLEVGGNSSDSVSGLSVQPDSGQGSGSTAVQLDTGTATNIEVTSATPDVYGVALNPGTSLLHSTVTLPLTGSLRSQAVTTGCCATSGVATVFDDTLTADDAANMTAGTSILARDTFTADYEGARCGADCSLQDSVIAMTTPSVAGFEAYCQTSASTGVSLLNDTIVGGANQSVFANCPDSGQTATVNVFSTLLRGAAGQALNAIASGGTVAITPSYDDFDPATDSTSGAAASIASDAHHINADPLFINPAAGDYRIPYNSPLVDAGRPDPIGFLESATDLAGNPRIVNARRDIGAYEYQRLKPSAVITQSAIKATTGQAVSFDGSKSTDGDAGDTLTYSWSFDDGTTAQGATIAHAFATAGSHTATLTVTDPTNLSATMTASVSVSTPSGGPGPSAGTVSLSHLTQSTPTWTEGRALALFTRHRARHRIPVGTTFGFTLNVSATVRITFTRIVSGRSVGGRCVASTRRNRSEHSCVRALAAGSITHAAHAGANTVRFQGRLSVRAKLRLGRYRATFTATRPTAKASAPLSLTFTVVATTRASRAAL